MQQPGLRLANRERSTQALKDSYLPAALLVLLGLLVYWNSFPGIFLFDDYSCIHENLQIRHLWPWGGGIVPRAEIALAGRPLPILLTAWNYAFNGLNPFGYHLFNVTLHLINALLFFGIIRRTASVNLAFTSAALWLTHPLVTESVNYIIQRTELLAALGLLAMLYGLIRASKENKRVWLAFAAAACAFGMMSKESTVVAPLLAALYDRTFLSGNWRKLWQKRSGFYLCLAATWLILAGLLSANPRSLTAGFQASGVSAWHYFLTQSRVVFYYLRLSIWPSPLVVDYGDWPLATSWREVWVFLVGIVVGLAQLTQQLRKGSVTGFLGAWVVLTLAPTSSFIPIATELAAERRMYLPLCAMVVAAVAGGWWVIKRTAPLEFCSRLAVTIWAMFFASAALVTIHRNNDYQSEVGMLQDVIRKRPGNARAYYNLGIALGEQRNLADSFAAFDQAIRLKPDYVEARYNQKIIADAIRLRKGSW